jgi:hypothetical protein
MTSPIPASLERFGAELDRAAHRELSARSEPRRARASLLRRPRVLAGSSLGLAGAAAAALLALGGTAATTPAYAITQKSDGSVFLKLNFGAGKTLLAADSKLVDRYHETVMITTASGRSTSSAPINCVPTPDRDAPGDPTPPGPRVRLLVGKDNTFVGPMIGPTGNSGPGIQHVVSCQAYLSFPQGSTDSGNSGS